MYIEKKLLLIANTGLQRFSNFLLYDLVNISVL